MVHAHSPRITKAVCLNAHVQAALRRSTSQTRFQISQPRRTAQAARSGKRGFTRACHTAAPETNIARRTAPGKWEPTADGMRRKNGSLFMILKTFASHAPPSTRRTYYPSLFHIIQDRVRDDRLFFTSIEEHNANEIVNYTIHHYSCKSKEIFIHTIKYLFFHSRIPLSTTNETCKNTRIYIY